jgi:ribosomal protein S18 acetylase RimI-like enzyme
MQPRRLEGSKKAAQIREATIEDCEQVARLVSGLGYPTSSTQMRKRLASILADADYATLVACEGEQIVGFIGTRVGPLYEDDGYYGQIMALDVASEYQRRGIGRMLIQAAESIMSARGACVLVVTSGNQRADAHAFYEHRGYAFTARRYKKTLTENRPL